MTRALGPCLFIAAAMLSVFDLADALRCHNCDGADWNSGRCTDWYHSEVCDDSMHDTCISIVKWSTTNFWLPGGRRKFYIYKGCSRKDACYQMQQRFKASCNRLYDEDWTCVECCQEDQCNYWVNLDYETHPYSRGAFGISQSKALLGALLGAVFLLS